MKYTAEQIKPKKYPDEKPSEDRAYVNYRVLLDNGTQSLFNWNPISQSDGKMIWNKYVTWFIDIPNPPDELKFLAYPQNKPEEAGLYLAHYKPADDWGDIYYPDENIWDEHIDYFIPIRLDKENEMDVNKRLDKLEDVLTELQVFLNGEGILPGVHYFDNDVVKRVGQPSFKDKVLWHDKHIEITDLDGFTDVFMIASISSPKRYVFVTDEQLAECHKAVEEREPELKACPNPICEQTKYLEVIEIPSRYAYPNKEFIVECKNCGYRGGRGSSEEQAVKLHNLIADNAKRSSLCEPENEYYGLWCDEDGNVLPRKEK